MLVLIAIFIFFIICGLVSVTNQLQVLIKNQIEIIRLLKK